ncbi:hypothetical protein AB0G41_30905 [Streptomyces rimosus]|nr:MULTISPECIES: hypothetical protein [Streptomyces]MYT42725.1 hypothetical protein [Streptomyces sp. SID5471]QGY69910.1 hypothetical protein V519_032220 [Streptomyces rimosus R6-500]QTL86901.1 hypothetical protein FMM49_15150 [Streptomyces rimosus subsp. rimosus]
MSTRTQAPQAFPAQDRRMLWSDPPDEPPEELRQVQAMLRRMGIVLAVAAVVLMVMLVGGA